MFSGGEFISGRDGVEGWISPLGGGIADSQH